VDRRDAFLLGGYGGVIYDNTLLIGAAGYWQVNSDYYVGRIGDGGRLVEWYALREPVTARTADAGYPMSGTPSPRQIFLASELGISTWRGTASTVPVLGLCHNECEAPSRFRTHPCLRTCWSSAVRFTPRSPSHVRHPEGRRAGRPRDDRGGSA
jgi:hypothetical protein